MIMNKKILWLEDDHYAIKGLMRPLELAGFTMDVAASAVDGYEMAQNWQQYDLFVVDLIIPLSNDDKDVTPELKAWDDEEFLGIAFTKWLKDQVKVDRPVLIMSVVGDISSRFNLAAYDSVFTLSKRGLLPSSVKAEVFRILNIKA
jgi:CheY-like chemotaxis protein